MKECQTPQVAISCNTQPKSCLCLIGLAPSDLPVNIFCRSLQPRPGHHFRSAPKVSDICHFCVCCESCLVTKGFAESLVVTSRQSAVFSCCQHAHATFRNSSQCRDQVHTNHGLRRMSCGSW